MLVLPAQVHLVVQLMPLLLLVVVAALEMLVV